MKKVLKISGITLFLFLVINNANCQTLESILGRCQLRASNFNECMKDSFNDLRAYFKTGIPDYNILPFDPHRAKEVRQIRGNVNGLLGYSLILRNVSEYGWQKSEVTKFKMDIPGNRIIYSQYFPEKSLDGYYEFEGTAMGANLPKRQGLWNLTLYDYSQTTSVKRLGGIGSPLKVHVEIDKIGGMSLHISDIFGRNRQVLNGLADTVINSMWGVGLPFIRPLINDLVSTAFTEIFNQSFRYFPVEGFIK